ncbi:MAG: plasmid pRiA4b ORF-3 family protein, partial [bacterium]|nr:plasmid pRiA4b ORF-3 family protein [bacterium]
DAVMLSQFRFREDDGFVYEYDFGDSWEHIIVVQDILLPDPRIAYPVCTGGRRAGPPEDCGGPWGFMSRYNARRKGARIDRFDRRTVNVQLKQYALGNEEWQCGLDG